jgi:hypothetical protein
MEVRQPAGIRTVEREKIGQAPACTKLADSEADEVFFPGRGQVPACIGEIALQRSEVEVVRGRNTDAGFHFEQHSRGRPPPTSDRPEAGALPDLG